MQADGSQVKVGFLQEKALGLLMLLILIAAVLDLASLLLRATGLFDCVIFFPLGNLTQVVFFKENFIKSWPNTASILSKGSDLQQSWVKKEEEEDEEEEEASS